MEPTESENIKSLLQSGYVEAAQHALEDILRANPKDLQAWSLYVKSWSTPEKRIKALQLCLKYNPGNADVQRALDSLKSKINAGAAPPKPASAPRPAPPPPTQPPSPSRGDQMPDWMRGLGGNVPDNTPIALDPVVPPTSRQEERSPARLASSDVLNAPAASAFSTPAKLSKEDIDRQAREMEEENRRARLDLGRPMAWYEVWYTAVTQPNVDAYDALRLDPYAMPSRTYIWLISAGLVYGLIFALAFGINPQFFQVLSMMEQDGQLTGITQVFGAFLFCMVPFFGVMNLFGTAINVGIMHLVANLMGGKGKYSEFLYLMAAFSAPIQIGTSIVGFIPFVGACLSLPLAFYNIYLTIQAIRSAHNFDSLRAIGVLLGVFLLSGLFVCLFGYLIYSYIAPYIPAQPTY